MKKKSTKKCAENRESEGADNTPPRPLPGCVLPGCLLLPFLLAIPLYFAGWCVATARYPGVLPVSVFAPVNFLRFHWDAFYRMSESAYRLAGGTRDPFVRGALYDTFRADRIAEDGSRTVWLVSGDGAEERRMDSAGRFLESETHFMPEGREVFLQQFRSDGEYEVEKPYPGTIFFRSGRIVSKRFFPLDKTTSSWMFECRYRKGLPYAGWQPEVNSTGPEDMRERAKFRLGGKVLLDVFFPTRVIYRGHAALGESISKECAALVEYEFGFDRLALYHFALSSDKISSLTGARGLFRWPSGDLVLSDSLIRMAVRKSDMTLLEFFLRSSEARQEFAETERKNTSGVTCLHEAAVSRSVPILAKIAPLYPEINIREPVTGATPFLAAVMADRTDNVLLFLRRSDRMLNAKLNDGSTALHIAVENLSPDTASLLLSFGADAKLRNANGETALDVLKRTIREENIPETDSDVRALLNLLE